MKQITFGDAKYTGKCKQFRKKLFLIETDQVVSWKGLVALVEPRYQKGEGGRPSYPLRTMQRVQLMQNWFGYYDPAMEKALYDTTILCQFTGLSLKRISEETTILNFRRLLEKHELTANVADFTQVDQLLHGEEPVVCADADYTGMEKRAEYVGRKIMWQIAAQRSTYKKHGKRSLLYRMKRKIEKAKAQTRTKIEHPLRVIKRQFGYTKGNFCGLVKGIAQLVTRFALVNLWMARRHLLTNAGEVRL